MSVRLRIVFMTTSLIAVLFSIGGAIMIHTSFQASLEKEEQTALRKQFVEDFKRNLRGTLDNIDIKEKDGSITHVKDIPLKKKNKPKQEKKQAEQQ